MLRALLVGCWSLAALALHACTVISGLDDKIFDLGGAGGSASGTGGAGGAAGSDAGGGGSSYVLATPSWAVRLGGPAAETAAAVAVGPSQEIVIAGYYEGDLPLPGTNCSVPPPIAGWLRIFVAKLTGPNACAWAWSFGKLDARLELDVAVDSMGSVFVVGGFDGYVPIDELSDAGAYDSGDAYDGFWIKLSADGSLLGHDVYGGDGTQRLSGVAAGDDGVTFVVGHHERPFALGGNCGTQPSCASCEDNVVVAQIGPDAGCQYAHGWDNPAEQHGYAVAQGIDDTVAFTGLTRGSIDFGGGQLTGIDGGDPDIYVAQIRLDPYEHRWSYRWGDEADQRGKSVAVDPTTGDVFVTGVLDGGADFGHGLEGYPDQDAFLVRLSHDGGLYYGRAFGALATRQSGSTVLARSGGAALLGGTFEGTLACSEHEIEAVGTDMFLARFAPDGSAAHCQSFRNSAVFTFADMAALGSQSIVLFGDFIGDMEFGSDMLTSEGTESDLFLAAVELMPGL